MAAPNLLYARGADWTLSAVPTLALLLALMASACSDPAPLPVDTDTTSDVDALATDVTATTKDVQVDTGEICPGGEGCACEENADCANSHCLADEAGAKFCARSCQNSACPSGTACGTLDGLALCIPSRGNLCDPCLDSATCAIPGLTGAACVHYGDAGAFCGNACTGDSDCGAGYACRLASRVEGGQTQQCVRVDGVGALAECTCSPKATAAQLKTACAVSPQAGTVHACAGIRTCAAAGLSLCTALTPSSESCDGVDNDCNGATDEGTCDDNNPCTTDTCGGASGCTHTNNTAPCGDGDACTSADVCKDGKCGGVTTDCNDDNPCTDDTCVKTKGCVYTTQKAACEDGDACTYGDTCAGGFCLPGVATTCDDDNACTSDNCGPSGCEATATTGGVCDDGDACSVGDTCTAGQCGGKAKDCGDANPCTADSCESGGLCVNAPIEGACDDSNACTDADTCKNGACAGDAKSCTSPSTCVTAFCSPAAGGCGTTTKADGAACSDGDSCTSNDACLTGACLGETTDCNDDNACTADSCASSTGCGHVGLPGGCTDGNACTEGDNCSSGFCAGTPVSCTDGNQCTDDTCAPASGCAFANRTGGCDDGKPCTGDDACTFGTCAGSTATDCADTDACTLDSCDTVLGCQHVPSDGNACDVDANLCTEDVCAVGTCTAGTPTDCEDNNVCTTDSCNTSTGACSNLSVASGSPCDDNDVCTQVDGCSAGNCVGGSPQNCADSESCTTDTCDKTLGCQHADVNAGPCDSDGNLCTGEVCVVGLCTAATATDCDDANDCTSDSCDTATGTCNNVNVSDGLPCSDGNACSTGDECTAGVCAGSQPLTEVTTYAGSGTQGFADDIAVNARFNNPKGIAIGSDGMLYVADNGGAKVRRVALDGAVTTWAGEGILGYVEGVATGARFRTPEGVLVVGTDVYVTDSSLQNLRRIDATQQTHWVAGNDQDAVFPSAKVLGDFVDGPVANARFSTPLGLAYDPTPSVIYVADSLNHAIRAVDLIGAQVSTLCGNGASGMDNGVLGLASFNLPSGLWLDATGKKLYVADAGNNAIRLIDLVSNMVSTVAGDGTAGFVNGASPRFSAPRALVGDGTTLWIADSTNHRIRALTGSTASTLTGDGTTVFANGTFATATFNTPYGIVSGGTGVWYVSDQKNHRIRKLLDPNAGCVP